MIPVYENAGLYSAATSAGILFYAVSRLEAERILANAGIDPAVLDNPVDGLTWRSTLTSAFANEIQSLSKAVDSLPVEAAEQVAAIHDRLDVLGGRQAELQEQLKRADIRAEIARLEADLASQLPVIMQQLGKRYSQADALAILWYGPLGQRIKELRAAL